MRIALAILVLAFALPVALYLHDRKADAVVCLHMNTTAGYCDTSTVVHGTHPTWENPVALGVALAGIGIAVGIVTIRRRPSVAS